MSKFTNLFARVDIRLIVRYTPVVIMLLLPFVIFGPLLGRGYILQYDMVFAPNVYLNTNSISEGHGLYQSLPLNVLLKIFSFILPMDIVQKLILYIIFFVCVFSMYKSVPVKSIVARLLAGLIYMINPFTYDRLMAGHWIFLLAYSITPFVIRAFYELYTNPQRKNLLRAILWWSLAVIISAHHLIILGLIFVCFAIIFVRSRRSLLYTLTTVLGVFMVNIWWIIPAIIAPSAVGSFGIEHFYAFATKTDLDYGIWFNMLSLQGFWYTGWQSIKDTFGLWPLIVMIWLLPVFIGIGAIGGYGQNHKKLLAGLLLASFIGLVLASGPHPAFFALNGWIFTNLPGMAGMRESQKFLALLALTYSVLVAYGINGLLQIRLKRSAYALSVVLILSTVLLVRPMLGSGNGQITVTNYPASWYQFSRYLETSTSKGKTVVLPWNLYVNDSFVDTLVANPAKAFYGDKVIQSQRIKLSGVKDLESPLQANIGKAVDKKDNKLLIEAMREVNATFIMITNTKSNEYAWLLGSSDLHMVIDDQHLTVLSLTTQ